MKRFYWSIAGLVLPIAVLLVLSAANATREKQDLLWHHRNLGKAFYENPTTLKESAAEFKKALEVSPDSARERVNYGLALLRAGQTKDSTAELVNTKKKDPEILQP